ncbi:MAG: HIT family protein [Cryobacterium sp.]|nr:HIT family protein [Oligoflexia bacterium]
MTSPFSRLIDGSDREWILTENEYFLAVLETKPLVLGHVVVVAKEAKDGLFDLADGALSSLLVFSKPIAKAIEMSVTCKKVGVAVIGLETRHAHLHLVPISSAQDLNFTREKLRLEECELIEIRERIRASLATALSMVNDL